MDPPRAFKIFDSDHSVVNGQDNGLRPDAEARYARYCADLLIWMRDNGMPLPHSFSFQNEPQVRVGYDGGIMQPEQYRRVAKLFRRHFNERGLSQVLINGDDGGNQKMTMDTLGLNPARNGVYDTDTELRNAIGVISTHTYDLHNDLLNWYPNGLQDYFNATSGRPQERWMTEWEIDLLP